MYNRGDVYLVQEDQNVGSEIKKTRPWVIVGANFINRSRSTIIAVPLSTQVKEIPHLSIKILFNNSTVCAILDQIRALDKRRFLRSEGSLTKDELDLIDAGLRQVLYL